jgi:hypothetical protein
VTKLGLWIGGQMSVNDARNLHTLQQRPEHGERTEVTALGLRLVSIPSDRHAYNMANRRKGRNTTFGDESGCGI